MLKRLNATAPLSEAETHLVERCVERIHEHRPGKELVSPGAPRKPTMILAGWACRQRLLPDGRRQIFELLIPGDLVGLAILPEPTTSLAALTRLETADASHLALALESDAYPALAQALTAGAIQAQERLLDQVMRLGRHTAYERMAHLLLEMSERSAAAGLADQNGFPFLATQQVLADLLGLSVVHINRTLQQLRREGLIELGAGAGQVLNPAGLRAAAGCEDDASRSQQGA